MKSTLLLALVFAAACGGSKAKPVEPKPAPPDNAMAAAPPPAADKAAEPAAPMPPAPRLALVDGKVTIAAGAKPDSFKSEGVFKADGTVTFTMTGTGKKAKTQTKTGKLTADGELHDDKDTVIAKLDDAGMLSTLAQMETRENGKVVKSESKWEEVGTLDADGNFTGKKGGMKVAIGADGKVTGLPPDLVVTVDGSSKEAKRTAVFLVVSMLAGGKAVIDSGPASSAPAKVPAKK